MNYQLQKAIELSRKTGDRLIVLDLQGKISPFVIMPMDEYEELIGFDEPVHELTEEELLDKINCDIAEWRERKDRIKKVVPEMPVFKNDYEFDAEDYQNDDEDDDDIDDYTGKFDGNYLFKDEDFDHSDDFENLKHSEEAMKKKKGHWQIPSERKEAAEEVIEEDRQYLEDVPF